MNEQQVNALIAALQEETKAKKEQTAALTRPAESNESLVAVLVDAFSNDMGDVDIIKKMRTKTISAIGVIMQAGKLRHRITLQKPVKVQDPETGSVENIWQDLAQLWAEVSPLSPVSLYPPAMQNAVTTRITVRYRQDIEPKYRILFRGKIFNIEGVLSDPKSGIEYLTLPCSEGTNDG